MAQAPDERRLLAIMFTDVVGYTALTERDEDAAVRLRERHRDLVRALVEQFEGEVVDATGDESMSIFGSALRAVDCALALQGALRSHPDLRLRIGIHLGDVLRRDGEVIGEGVNVASRVRPLAEPGGICVSEPVYQLVRSRAQVRGRALGPQSLKNVAEPLEVWAISAADGADAAPARPQRRSLRLVGALAAVALLVALVAVPNRGAILAWIALNAPRLLGSQIEQQIGFAETTDDVRIAYATSGEGAPVVTVLGWATHLTEGLGSPLYDQGGALGYLSRSHLVIRYDGRGFGLSDRDVTDFSIESRVQDLAAVVDALGLERFALYAISAGGPAALAYTDRHPERVSRLILAATGPGSALDPQSEEIWRQRIALIRVSWDDPTTRAMIAEFLAPEAGDAARRVLMHFLHISGNGPQVAGFFEAGGELDESEAARRIRVPTLVVAGDLDPGGMEGGRLLASLIPGARFEILEGAGHIESSVSDPRLLRLVSDFLAQNAGSIP